MVQASLIGSADASKLTAFVQASQGSEEGEDEIGFATKDMKAAKTDLSASAEKKSTAEGDLTTTSKDLAEDTKAKAALHQECMTKSEDFEAETKSRGEELKALATAKKVIVEATGGAESFSYGASFLQTSMMSRSDLAAMEVVRAVRDLSHKTRAPALAQLAQRIDAAAHSHSKDVFGKIKGLIADMISKLEAEAEEEATKKAYCDKEMSETEAKKEEKETEVKKLTTSIDQMVAKSATLKEEVAELQASLASLRSSQAG